MSLSIQGILAIIVGLIIVVVASIIIAARLGMFELSDKDLRERHTLPESKFVDVDGINFHYLDEGQGEVVLLLHGSFLNLRDWDDWSRELVKAGYRVVRVDRIGSGLTAGYKSTDGGGYAKEIEVLGKFIKTMKFEPLTLVGTSSAGVVAFSYAADHPESVKNLVLMNFPLGHSRIGSPDSMKTALKIRALLKRYQPEYYTRQLLRTNLTDHSKITPELVTRMTDFANREGLQANAIAGFKGGAQLSEEARRQSLTKLAMPTLFIWSENNRMVSVKDGREAFDLLPATQKSFVTLPDAAHMVPLEKGEESVKLAIEFLRSVTPAAATPTEAAAPAPMP